MKEQEEYRPKVGDIVYSKGIKGVVINTIGSIVITTYYICHDFGNGTGMSVSFDTDKQFKRFIDKK